MGQKILFYIRAKFNYHVAIKIILAIFILEGLYFTFFATFPQAFDENFHFGLIQIYSHHLSPFLTSQPNGGNPYGAVARDPSYLYHYLLSFPYRIFNLFNQNQTAQIIFLRLINLIIFVTGLLLFKKIMEKVGLSKKLIVVSLLLFILIPIVPQLAGQINYDNLVFLMTGLIVLWSLKLIDKIKQKNIDPVLVLAIISLSILTSLVKFEFMPIFLAITIYLLVIALKTFRNSIKLILLNLYHNFRKISLSKKIFLVSFLILSLIMFVQRDGYNLIKYHSINPKCDTVLNKIDCQSYSVWYHDYVSHQLVSTNTVSVNKNIFYYIGEWFYWIWYRLFFAVSGQNTNFSNYPPLPLPSAAFILISLISLYAFFRLRTKLFKISSYVNMLTLISVIYVLTLFYEGYKTYQYTGVLELMNGRYLVPILLLIITVSGMAISKILFQRKKLKIILASIVILLFLQGGGVITFITRSDSNWLWDNTEVHKINKAAKKISKHLIVEGSQYYISNVWFL